MTTGTNSFEGRAVPLRGESEIKGITAATDLFTLTGAASQTGTLFTVQASTADPAVYGLRVYPYGRTRIIRTDAVSSGGAFKNALDVKYDVDYAMGAVQAYAATLILDTSGGSAASGRTAVLNLQYSGDITGAASPAATSYIYINDLSSDDAEMPAFVHFGGITADDGGCFDTISDPATSRGLVVYVNNEKFWIQCSSAST